MDNAESDLLVFWVAVVEREREREGADPSAILKESKYLNQIQI